MQLSRTTLCIFDARFRLVVGPTVYCCCHCDLISLLKSASKTKMAPSWLTPNRGAAPETPAAPAPTAREIQEMKDLPGVIQFMRLLNLGAAGGLIAAAIWCMVTIPGPARLVLSIYAICGACLICCLETNLKFLRVMIAVNFGFLFSPLFRFMYYMLMAGVSLTLDKLLAYIVAGVFVGVALYNTYVLFRYPAYKKLRDSIAEEEDKRIDAAITKTVRKQAVKQMFGNK